MMQVAEIILLSSFQSSQTDLLFLLQPTGQAHFHSVDTDYTRGKKGFDLLLLLLLSYGGMAWQQPRSM